MYDVSTYAATSYKLQFLLKLDMKFSLMRSKFNLKFGNRNEKKNIGQSE